MHGIEISRTAFSKGFLSGLKNKKNWEGGMEMVTNLRADRKPPGEMAFVETFQDFRDVGESVMNRISSLKKLLGLNGLVVGHESEVVLELVMVKGHSR